MQLDASLHSKLKQVVEHQFVEDTADYLITEMPELLGRPDIDMVRIEQFCKWLAGQAKQRGVESKGSVQFLCLATAKLGIGFDVDKRFRLLQEIGAGLESNKIFNTAEMSSALDELSELWQSILEPNRAAVLMKRYEETKALPDTLTKLYEQLDMPVTGIEKQLEQFDHELNEEIATEIEKSGKTTEHENPLGIAAYKILRHDFGTTYSGHLSGNFYQLNMKTALATSEYNPSIIALLKVWGITDTPDKRELK